MAEQMTRTILVGADISTVFKLWANFENFPQFMKNIESVRNVDDRTSHWTMRGPLGFKVEWDAETTRLEPNTRIAWNSKDNAGLTTSGEVLFRELANAQTEVTAQVQYVPPAGTAGEIVTQLFANPAKKLEEDLRNFKAFAERMGSTQAR